VPLSDAAKEAYEKTLGTSLARNAEAFARDERLSKPGIYEYYAQYLTGTGKPIYGSHVPSTEVIRLPDDLSSHGNPVDGGARFQLYGEEEPTYTSLQILRSDLNAA